jgi:transposase
VRRFVSRRLAALGIKRQQAKEATSPKPASPSARALAFAVIRRPTERTAREQARVTILAGINEQFREVPTRAEEFAAMLRKQTSMMLADWLAQAERSANPHLRGFTKGIKQDEAAVAAAITQPWSNGAVEGHVNRLKLIKRQMFGRASFELLRRRVLHRG